LSELSAIPAYFVLARAIHFAACLLLFSVCVFDRFIVSASIREFWNRISKWLIVIAMPMALLSGIAWFAAVSIQMSDQPLSASVMQIVWSQTQFGTLCKLRLLIWICLLIFFWFRLRWTSQIFGGIFVLSLAWAGHGQTGSSPRLHLFADVLHLLAAGCWPTSLLPLALLLWRMRKDKIDPAAMVHRFSTMSIIAVALLLVSGIANSFFLLEHVSDFFVTTYGRVLLMKIMLFILMLALGAVNLLILKPRLPRTTSQLRWTVSIEMLLTAAVLIVVAILGLLPPALQ
jgi:putative copper resistance protein D